MSSLKEFLFRSSSHFYLFFFFPWILSCMCSLCSLCINPLFDILFANNVLVTKCVYIYICVCVCVGIKCKFPWANLALILSSFSSKILWLLFFAISSLAQISYLIPMFLSIVRNTKYTLLKYSICAPATVVHFGWKYMIQLESMKE